MRLKNFTGLVLSLIMIISNLNISFAEDTEKNNILVNDEVVSGAAVVVEEVNYDISLAGVEAGADGFIVPLEKPMPKAGANGFIAEISEPDPNATVITTAEELANIQSGGNYVLGNDIDLSTYNEGVWTPINSTGEVTLDGQGHKISNMIIPKSANVKYAGLFGKVENNVTIKNIGLAENCNVNSRNDYSGDYSGGLIACCDYVDNFSITIENSYNNGNVSSDNYMGLSGGLVGIGCNTTIENSYNSGDVTSSDCSGGLIGYCSGNITIENSYNDGDVTSNYNASSNSGGLIGDSEGCDITIENSYNSGNVTSNGDGGGLVSGGFVKAYGITIENSYNSGDVTSSDCSGGLIGYCSGNITIENSYNSGNVTSNYNDGRNGGLVGYCYSSITIGNIYSLGEIKTTSEKGNAYRGGIAGYAKNCLYINGKNYYADGDEICGNEDAKIIYGEGAFCIKVGSVLGEDGSGIAFTQPRYELEMGQVYIYHLNLEIRPATDDISDIIFTSSNPDIAEIANVERGVGGSGFTSVWCDLNLKETGSTVITATNSKGASSSCIVSVDGTGVIGKNEIISISEVYPVNADSIIMKGGTAIRYYKAVDNNGEPISNKNIRYKLKEGQNFSSKTDEDGLFSVEITASEDGRFALQTQQYTGELRENDKLPPSFNVKVTEPNYSQGSTYSAGISGEIGAGIKAEAFNMIDVSLLDASINGELGRSFGINYQNNGDKTDLNLTVKNSSKIGSKESVGLGGTLFNDNGPNMSASTSVGASYGQNLGYTFTFKDFFNKDNPDYHLNGAIAGLAVIDNSWLPTGHSILIDKIYETIYTKIKPNINSSVRRCVEQNVKINEGVNLKVDSGKIFENMPAAPTATLFALNGTETHKYSGNAPIDITRSSELKASSSVTSKTTQDFLKIGIKKNISSDEKIFESDKGGKLKTGLDLGSLYNKEFETSKTISSTFKANGKTEKVALSVEIPEEEDNVLDFSLTDENVNKKLEFVLTGNSLNESLANTNTLKSLASGERTFINDDTFTNIYGSLNDIENYVDYNLYQKKSSCVDFPLKVSLGAGISLGIGADLKAVWNEEYKTSEGVFNKGNSFVTAKYDNIDYTNKHNTTDFLAVIGDAFGYYVSDMFTSAKDNLVNGVQNELANVKGTVKGWIVRITSFNDTQGISLLSIDEDDMVNPLATAEDKAETIGKIYIVEVLDENENAISEFVDNPVELKLEYTEDMLSGKGNEDSLNIYYWDEERCLYVKINSELNKEEKYVTANVTKSGQYVLGIDESGPEISDLTLSSDSVYANILDMTSGVNVNSIELTINGTIISAGSNSSKYYNTFNGYFNYPMKENLTNKPHTIILTAIDNSGNKSEKILDFIPSNFEPIITASEIEPENGKEINISIKTGVEDAKIYYTTDGTEPTVNSKEYMKPFTISGTDETIIVKAITAVDDKVSEVTVKEIKFSKYDLSDIKFGDIDGKRGVTANDAALVLQKVLNSSFPLPIQEKTNEWMKYADVSGDKKLTATDAAIILQKALDSNFTMPVEVEK